LQATSVYTQQLLELHRGQGMEIYWRDNYACPTEEEYRDMTKRSAYNHVQFVVNLNILPTETGGLFMLAIRLMQLFSDCKADFTKLAGIIGLYFQIRDDYGNLCLQEVNRSH
jgi:geranylgeranyl diphosphate synthase, type III